METFYSSYTKMLDFKTYYFIKKFSAFPELKNVPPIMESYGMHTDFDKACSIAGLQDATIKEQLLQEATANSPRAKVIDLSDAGFAGKSVAG